MMVSGLMRKRSASVRTVSPSSTVWLVGLGGWAGATLASSTSDTGSFVASGAGVGTLPRSRSTIGGLDAAASAMGRDAVGRGCSPIVDTVVRPTAATTPCSR